MHITLKKSAAFAGLLLALAACTPTSDNNGSTSSNAALAQEGELCGGFAAFMCDEGLTCIDDPNDICDPTAGGADCGGICARP